MRTLSILSLSLFAFVGLAGEDLKHGPDSEYHEGVPKGKVEQQAKWKSTIFPGTERDWWIYVPAQYDAAKPANIMVFQDGGGPKDPKGEMRVPVVFDNLIHKGDMPVTLGIFIPPGTLPPADNREVAKSESRIQDEIAALVAKGKSREEAEKSVSKTAPKQSRQNRAFEYDSVGDRYARFLIEEILAEVVKKYNITSDPAGRAICGQSSGGSCAFTVAWERPDAFGKVVSGIGSFTSLHGCNAYPDLIRKMEPKPIRIYMQDNDHDLDIYAGSWWHANMDMAAALRWSGYDYFFLQGTGGHSGRQLGVNFPDAMRWLWRKDPVQGKRPNGVDQRGVFEVLVKDEGWKLVSPLPAGRTATGIWPNFMIADGSGDVYFHDGGIQKLNANGERVLFAKPGGTTFSMHFSPDGKLYTATNDGKVIAIDGQGATSVVADKLPENTHLLAVNHKGEIYLYSWSDFKMRLIDANKTVRVLPGERQSASALLLTPDQGFAVTIHREQSDFTLNSYRVEANGDLTNQEPFYSVQTLEGQNTTGNSYGFFDDKGRLYVFTEIGVQIFDQGGRVIGILSLPERNNIQGMCLGGPKFDTLYAYTNKGIYARKLNARGVRSCDPPVTVKPPQM